MISLMIADDNVQWVEQISNFLTKEDDFKIINKSYNGLDTIMHYTELKPDVLLLDLDMPGMNGIDIIDYFCTIPSESDKQNIIVVSGDQMYQSQVRSLPKVKGMIDKFWNLDFLTNLIRDIKETDTKKILVKTNIDILFDKLNFDSCLKGTSMLKDAIFTAFYENQCYENIDKLFHELSKHYPDITIKTIRTDIDNAISIMYNYNGRNPKFFCTFFPDYFGFKPTTKHFVKCAVKYLRNIVNQSDF